MNIQDALKTTKSSIPQIDDIHFMSGTPESHEIADSFRLYPDPLDRDLYFIIQNKDIVGDIIQWTESEMQTANLIGNIRFRIPIRDRALVRIVEISREVIGEDFVGESSSNQGGSGKACVHGSCRQKPCKEWKNGRWKCSYCCQATDQSSSKESCSCNH